MGFSDDPLLPFGISAWDFQGLTHISLYTVSLHHYNLINSNKLTHDLHHPQQEKSWALHQFLIPKQSLFFNLAKLCSAQFLC